MTSKDKARIKQTLASIMEQLQSGDDQLVTRSMVYFHLLMLWQEATKRARGSM